MSNSIIDLVIANGNGECVAVDRVSDGLTHNGIQRNQKQQNNHAALVAQSATMGVGLTIKSLNSVFLVNLKSASTATLQGIGRGLMLEEGKDKLRIFDIFASGRGDNFKYSKRHRKNRQHLLADYYKCEEDRIRRIEI